MAELLHGVVVVVGDEVWTGLRGGGLAGFLSATDLLILNRKPIGYNFWFVNSQAA